MTHITTLKLVAASRVDRLSATERRRLKLIDKLDDQIRCLEASMKSEIFAKQRRVWRKNDDGHDEQVTITRTIRPWWWSDIKGQIFFALKYGSHPIELAKGKTAVQVPTMDDLLKAFGTVRQAVLAGELDPQLDQASLKTASRFQH
jgi:hypothetical protein